MTAGSGERAVVRPTTTAGSQPAPVPRDDRAWPRSSFVVSLLIGLVAVGTAVGLGIVAARRGGPAMVAVPAGFVLAFGVTLAINVAGTRRWMLGHPFPGGLRLLMLAVLCAGFALLAWYDGLLGGAILAGLFAGLTFPNAWAVRTARRNRPYVDAAEAATARTTTERADRLRPTPATRAAPVRRVLRDTVATERRRALAWLLAGVLVTLACVALGVPEAAVGGLVLVTGLAVVWVLRRLWGVWLALRDFTTAATAPRRAYVVLLHDPAPRMMRPLLGIWSEPPVVRHGRMPGPERVYRCDDEHDDLECFQGDVVVHEAWVDTGPRPTSKPRWVAADAGIALPHRRAVLGRWYVSNLIRADRPDRARPLTSPPPAPSDEPIVEAGRADKGFLAVFGWRVAGLAAVAALFAWLV
jgi:hypothetical protein